MTRNQVITFVGFVALVVLLLAVVAGAPQLESWRAAAREAAPAAPHTVYPYPPPQQAVARKPARTPSAAQRNQTSQAATAE